MERVRRNKLVIAVLVLPALIVYTFVLPYPLVRTAYYSLTNYNLLSAPITSASPTLEHCLQQIPCSGPAR